MRGTYPSYMEAVHLIQDGNFQHMPMLTANDIKRAYKLYGEPVGSIQGKMTKRKVSRAVYNDELVMDTKNKYYIPTLCIWMARIFY
jgi:hypothetical protein